MAEDKRTTVIPIGGVGPAPSSRLLAIIAGYAPSPRGLRLSPHTSHCTWAGATD